MKIIRPYAKLIVPWADESKNEFLIQEKGTLALQFIEWCARISHRAEDKQTIDSYKRFIQNVVIEHGDWSVVEHVSVSVDAVVDRGITHEWVRHRLFSYTQESTRFVNYEKKMPPSFIYPVVAGADIECKYCLSGNEAEEKDLQINPTVWGYQHINIENKDKLEVAECVYDKHWLYAIDKAEKTYRKLLSKGWSPQEARSVFPNALASRIITTTNLRAWRHFLIMRTSKEAHPQMRQVTIPLLKEFQDTFPILFDDIIPNEKQSIAMRKAQ